MEEPIEKKFSYPNQDQRIPGVSDDDRTIQSDPAPEPRPVVHILDALSKPKAEGTERTMRTYQEDITDAIKNDNVSMIKIALAEKKRQERQGIFGEKVAEESSLKKYLYIGVVAVILILMALGGIFLYTHVNAPEPTPQSTTAPRLLYTESSSVISVEQKSADDLQRLIKRELDTKLDLGSMEEIILTTGEGTTTREITTSAFFNKLGTRTPDGLARALGPVFLLGVYSFSPHDLFGVFTVSSYDLAFASMLQWEPDMETDIGGMFITHKATVPPPPITVDATTSTSTLIKLQPNSTFTTSRHFTDKVVDNKDARVLLNADGTIALLYTFLDKNTLVISSSDKALKEISFRLKAGGIAR